MYVAVGWHTTTRAHDVTASVPPHTRFAPLQAFRHVPLPALCLTTSTASWRACCRRCRRRTRPWWGAALTGAWACVPAACLAGLLRQWCTCDVSSCRVRMLLVFHLVSKTLPQGLGGSTTAQLGAPQAGDACTAAPSLPVVTNLKGACRSAAALQHSWMRCCPCSLCAHDADLSLGHAVSNTCLHRLSCCSHTCWLPADDCACLLLSAGAENAGASDEHR
jgi:hypothetical protein